MNNLLVYIIILVSYLQFGALNLLLAEEFFEEEEISLVYDFLLWPVFFIINLIVLIIEVIYKAYHKHKNKYKLPVVIIGGNKIWKHKKLLMLTEKVER